MRSHQEWTGKSDDSEVPPRIKLRVFEKFNGICQCGCWRKITAGERWEMDHAVALVNGGQNVESNLRPLLTEHHKNKTVQDVAEKSRTYHKRKAHLGIKKRGRPMPGSKASGWKKCFDGRVERRT